MFNTYTLECALIASRLAPPLPVKALQLALVSYGLSFGAFKVMQWRGRVEQVPDILNLAANPVPQFVVYYALTRAFDYMWTEYLRPRLPPGPDERCQNFHVRAKRRVELSDTPWSNDATRSAFEESVEANPSGITLTVVDPTSRTRARLFNDVFNGRENVYEITVADETPLDSSISRSIRLNQTLDLVGIANCMREAHQPLLRRFAACPPGFLQLRVGFHQLLDRFQHLLLVGFQLRGVRRGRVGKG